METQLTPTFKPKKNHKICAVCTFVIREPFKISVYVLSYLSLSLSPLFLSLSLSLCSLSLSSFFLSLISLSLCFSVSLYIFLARDKSLCLGQDSTYLERTPQKRDWEPNVYFLANVCVIRFRWIEKELTSS